MKSYLAAATKNRFIMGQFGLEELADFYTRAMKHIRIRWLPGGSGKTLLIRGCTCNPFGGGKVKSPQPVKE